MNVDESRFLKFMMISGMWSKQNGVLRLFSVPRPLTPTSSKDTDVLSFYGFRNYLVFGLHPSSGDGG